MGARELKRSNHQLLQARIVTLGSMKYCNAGIGGVAFGVDVVQLTQMFTAATGMLL